jgi:hypothetical protein
MKLKKLGLAFVVVCALGVVMASSAFAAAETGTGAMAQWYTGAAPGTLLSGSETVSSSGTGELVTEVGTTKLILKSTGLNCLNCKIENSGGVAVGSGELEFTGVTVSAPSTCAVTGGKVTTKPLKISADWMIGTADYIKFEPVTPSTFATLTLAKGTGACAIAGSYNVSGSVFVKANNATGVQEVSQVVQSSGAINKEAGGELLFGSKSAELNSTNGTFKLSGSKVGVAFGTH